MLINEGRHPLRVSRPLGGSLALVLVVFVGLALFTSVGVRTEARAAGGDISLFGTTVVPEAVSTETAGVNLGVRFTPTSSSKLVGLKFYRTSRQHLSYVGSLWSARGRLLAQATFSASDSVGWQSASLSTPVRLSAGQTYIASYLAGDGGYAYVTGGFSTTHTVDGAVVPSRGGVYRYGSASVMPTSSYQATNYLVDVILDPEDASSGPSVKPTPTETAVPTPSVSATPPPSSTVTSCPAGQVGASSVCAPAPPAPAGPGKTWRLTFNDEFDGSKLDDAKWASCFDWNYGACADSPNQGRERYLDSQVQVRDGLGRLVAEPLSPAATSGGCLQGRCDYKSGVITTARLRADDGSAYRYSFTYGYVEARLKLTSKNGFFSAFWLLPSSASFSYDTEIDIAEVLGGDPDTVFMTYHYGGRTKSFTPNRGDHNNGACAVKDYTKDFVRIGVDWQSDHIAWYVDGVRCGQFNGDGSTIEDGPMHLILNVMVDNAWQRDWKLTSSANDRDEMQIDYVRVFQQD